MTPIMIKVIKRKTLADIARLVPAKRPRKQATTVTVTVNGWIAENRQNRIGNDKAARAKIADWRAEANT